MPDPARRAVAIVVATIGLSIALAGVAAAHDCSSPRDCEQTAGYNAVIALTGGLVAVGAGLIGTYVGTSAGTTFVPPVPRPAAPVAPAPAGPLVDESGYPIARWEPGKYGADSAGRSGQPGDLWYRGRWQPEARVRGSMEQARAEQAQTARGHEEFQRVRDTDRGEDPGIKAIRDSHRATQKELTEERAELVQERQQLQTEIRDLNAEQAERWNAQAKRLERYSQTAGAIGTAADVGISILSNVPGGKGIEAAYTFTKATAGKLAEGEPIGTAVKAGVTDVVVSTAASKFQGVIGLEFKTPTFPNAPVASVFKSATKAGWQAVVDHGGKGLANWGVGEGIKYPFTKGAEFLLGEKEP